MVWIASRDTRRRLGRECRPNHSSWGNRSVQVDRNDHRWRDDGKAGEIGQLLGRRLIPKQPRSTGDQSDCRCDPLTLDVSGYLLHFDFYPGRGSSHTDLFRQLLSVYGAMQDDGVLTWNIRDVRCRVCQISIVSRESGVRSQGDALLLGFRGRPLLCCYTPARQRREGSNPAYAVFGMLPKIFLAATNK